MARILTTHGGEIDTAAGHEQIDQLFEQKEFFWLDIVLPDPEDFTLLKDKFGFHPLAIEDAEHFGQRPKLEEYDDFTFFVVYGVDDSGMPCEVHCFHSAKALITVRTGNCSELDSLRERFHRHPGNHTAGFLLYRVFDALVDSFFPALAEVGEQAEGLEDEIFDNPNREQLRTLSEMKKKLKELRRVIAPERDMLARLVSTIEDLDGIDNDTEHYFRDVYDHLIRLGDEIEALRDTVQSGRDIYLSSIGYVQNEVMKKLTVVAAIFLPLGFLTGYFGQNFGELAGKLLTPAWTFWAGGVALPAACLVGAIVFFRRKRWI